MDGGRLRKRTHVTTVSRRDDVPGVQRGYRRHLLRPERSPTGGTGRAGCDKWVQLWQPTHVASLRRL